MRTLSTTIGFYFLSVIVSFGCMYSSIEAYAQNEKWKGRLRLGPSIYTQDVGENDILTGDVGLAVNGVVLYKFSPYISLGPMLEFETHSLESDRFNVKDAGTGYTVSLLPVVLEVGPGRIGKFEPYGTLGLGVNINWVDEKFGKADPDNTFAFRIGGGADYFIMDNVALNAEFAWKLNSGEADVSGNGLRFKGLNFDASSALLLLGVRMNF